MKLIKSDPLGRMQEWIVFRRGSGLKHPVPIVQMAVALIVIASISCSGDNRISPPASEPDHHRYEWVVITDAYVAARAVPSRDGATTAILRAGEILPVRNIDVVPDIVHGQRGRWLFLEIEGADNGWVFESSFRGFYSREQASRFVNREMP